MKNKYKYLFKDFFSTCGRVQVISLQFIFLNILDKQKLNLKGI